MKREGSVLMVVDASVARSAGTTDHPTSKACRDYLTQILTICHRIAYTHDIRQEWRRHKSEFALKWLRSMWAKKKVLDDIRPSPTGLKLDDFPDREREAVAKDLCLLEAALSADRFIVTRDERLKQALAVTSDGRRLLRSITWVNPETAVAPPMRPMASTSQTGEPTRKK